MKPFASETRKADDAPHSSMPPSSPDAQLLDAWRRSEAATPRAVDRSPPSNSPPDGLPDGHYPAMPATDRVLREAFQVQLARAEKRANAQTVIAREARERTAQAEVEMEVERDAAARLREDLERMRARQHDEATRIATLTRSLRDAQAETDSLRKQRDHWRDGCQRAMVARDSAVRAAVALRELLRDTPGYEERAAAAIMRAQLLDAERELLGESPAPPPPPLPIFQQQLTRLEQNHADSLALRIDAIEGEMQRLAAQARRAKR